MSILTVSEVQGQLVVDSRLIAQDLGVEHESFMRTVKKYETKIEQRFGCIRFEIGVPQTPTGNPPKFAWLTEDQATALMTFSKNTDQVIECKLNLVEAFSKAKQIIREVIPAQSDRIRELELEVQLVQLQTQKLLTEKAILDTRHLIVATCSEPVQQKILGYTEVKTVEYRDRILHDEDILRDGSTISRSEACRRLGMMKGKQPDCKRLDSFLAKLPSDATKLSAVVQEYTEVDLRYWEKLKQMWVEDNNRDRFLCE